MVARDHPGASLLYHDIVPRDQNESTGIVTDGSWRYKIPPDSFRAHLDRIVASHYEVQTLPAADVDRPLLLTFDDGGVSCAETAAPLLKEYGMRGHFFVITGRIGEEGYLDRHQIRTLADDGHHIGSHTVTHPNLRELSPVDRRQELRESKRELEQLFDEECISISIPGGFVDKKVIADVFEAGYEFAFVSEPRYLPKSMSDCPLGRWNMWHDTTADDIKAILDRNLRTRLQIQGRWYALKMVKRLVGQHRYEWIRSPFVSQD
ncbi:MULTISPECIES: polysaccharide deacetylase family protein [Haloarcula]|uniref:polysaccharide deacetylase family protein n=1 Tax=Haloarcula TaxID=2237 RepID=UPI0013DF8D4C|nr:MULTISPECIES: polysaccharide deacetylase family protein [Haloarcula]NHX41500.1 polysaccharide deacetylase family protein [Haloarcula sp. R1-2]